MSLGTCRFDNFIFDDDQRKLWEIGPRAVRTPVHLSPQEYKTLLYYLEHLGRAIRHEDLWRASHPGSDGKVDPQSIDKLIQKLRDKINDRETKSRVQRAGVGFSLFNRDGVIFEPSAVTRRKSAAADREIDEAVAAWRDISFPDLFDAVRKYYEAKHIPLFEYVDARGNTTPVPIYVRSEWLNVDDALMDNMHLEGGPPRAHGLSDEQQNFLSLYPKVRKKLGLKPLWNGPVFRLVNLQQDGPQLKLGFEEGRFFDTLACQWVLEHETRLALLRSNGAEIGPRDLPIREALASSIGRIERFFSTEVARVGVSNLMLLRKSATTYQALIRARGALSMGAVGNFDPITSGIFEIATGTPRTDFDLQYKILKEICGELYNVKECERTIRHESATFFYKKPCIAPLRTMLKNGKAQFHVTGFCIDLIRLAPEITTVFVVNDESYYKTCWTKINVNDEYDAGGINCEVPRYYTNARQYLETEFPSDPARQEMGRGFDPWKWTLPGGFCLRQALERVARDRLFEVVPSAKSGPVGSERS